MIGKSSSSGGRTPGGQGGHRSRTDVDWTHQEVELLQPEGGGTLHEVRRAAAARQIPRNGERWLGVYRWPIASGLSPWVASSRSAPGNPSVGRSAESNASYSAPSVWTPPLRSERLRVKRRLLIHWAGTIRK
jgi:hypothetical protein